MSTIINAPSHWITGPAIQKQKNDSNIYNKLVVLPLPALLIFYYHGPVIVLAIAITLFFANIIACIGGQGMRSIVSIFALIIIDLIMLVMFLV